MKKIIVLLIMYLAVCGCNNTEDNSKKDIKEMMKENDYVIVDVRTKEEYQESHLVDAINIPYNQIDKNINLDKNKTIFVYCRSGTRSKIAFDTLTELGYTAYDLGAFSEIDLPKE